MIDTESSLWAAVGANPADQLPRVVLADWYEENAGVMKCERCGGAGQYEWYENDMWAVANSDVSIAPCDTCRRRGYVSDGRADMAAALRATVGRVPLMYNIDHWAWWAVSPHTDGDTYERERDYLTTDVHAALRPTRESSFGSREANYHTALEAIRDLCRAWVVVYRSGVTV